jgi:hypothetical protein
LKFSNKNRYINWDILFTSFSGFEAYAVCGVFEGCYSFWPGDFLTFLITICLKKDIVSGQRLYSFWPGDFLTFLITICLKKDIVSG